MTGYDGDRSGRNADQGREASRSHENQLTVEICMGSSCFARGNNEALPLIQDWLEGEGKQDAVRLMGHLCADVCSRGPLLSVGGERYEGLSPQDALELVRHGCRACRPEREEARECES